MTIYGSENIPVGTNFIGVSNHIGRLDPGLVIYLLKRRDIILMVAEKYKKHAWSRFLADAMNGIYVDRYNADLNAMREVLRRLKKGGVLALAPEGTRSPTASLQQARDGASYLAAKSALPVLPVGITGTEDQVVMDRLRHMRRLDITVRIGEPFTLPSLDLKQRDEQLRQATEEIMCRIAALLPASYRGVYANHPRLNELLALQTPQPAEVLQSI